jgi:hypothetical protein
VDEAKREDLVQIFNITSSTIPGFNTWMKEFMESPEYLEELCSRVRSFS